MNEGGEASDMQAREHEIGEAPTDACPPFSGVSAGDSTITAELVLLVEENRLGGECEESLQRLYLADEMFERGRFEFNFSSSFCNKSGSCWIDADACSMLATKA